MDFSETLFRSSAAGHLMTEPKSKKDKDAGNLSEGAKTHLVDIYVSAKYGRQSDIQNRYVTKGLMVEEDSITLYSRVKKSYFKKNEEHLSNEFIKGTPDMFTGKDIRNAEIIIDVKSSWDLFTFFRNHTKDVNSLYWWQLQCYMALTGAKSARLAYCLINTPQVLIEDEKRKLMYKMGCLSQESPEYVEACEELEKSMIYDDIPLKERLIEFEIERDNEAIKSLYERIKKARAYLKELDNMVSPPVITAVQDFELNAILIN
jgi:hypothetical protein